MSDNGSSNLVCPPGFERGLLWSCHAKCPAEFKYVGESSNTIAPGDDKCVHILRNNRYVTLTSLPALPAGETPPATYKTESDRVINEAEELKIQVKMDEEKERELNSFKDIRQQQELNFFRIKSEHAAYTSAQQGVEALKSVTDTLKPMRPKTAPGAAIELERKSLLETHGYSLFLVQLSLALLIASFVSYLTLPRDYAHAITFLLLCTGISFGFFLRK
jgi:hypothetical protein